MVFPAGLLRGGRNEANFPPFFFFSFPFLFLLSRTVNDREGGRGIFL